MLSYPRCWPLAAGLTGSANPPHGLPSLLPVSPPIPPPPDHHTAVLPDEGRSLQVQPGVRLHRADLHHHYPEPAPFNQVTDMMLYII